MSDATQRDDLVNIGVTESGEAVIQMLIERGWFTSEMAAFKAAVAYGIMHGIPPTESGRFETKWNVGSLDRTGEFIDIVSMLRDDERPWDYIRRVGDAALKSIEPRIERAEVPSDVFLSGDYA